MTRKSVMLAAAGAVVALAAAGCSSSAGPGPIPTGSNGLPQGFYRGSGAEVPACSILTPSQIKALNGGAPAMTRLSVIQSPDGSFETVKCAWSRSSHYARLKDQSNVQSDVIALHDISATFAVSCRIKPGYRFKMSQLAGDLGPLNAKIDPQAAGIYGGSGPSSDDAATVLPNRQYVQVEVTVTAGGPTGHQPAVQPLKWLKSSARGRQPMSCSLPPDAPAAKNPSY